MNANLAFIAAHLADYSIRLMCRVLGLSRSRFQAWRRTAPDRAARTCRWDALIDEIRMIFKDSKQRMAHLASTPNCEVEATACHARRWPG